MPAYSFRAQFVPKLLDGAKAQAIVAAKRGPQVGEVIHGYYGLRTPRCTWLFTSRVSEVEVLEMDLSQKYPRIRLDGREQSCYRVGALIKADGFKSVEEFRVYFGQYVAFTGWLMQWEAAEVQRCVNKHACEGCGQHLSWSVERRAFTCSCTNATCHYLKRPKL